ncbi:MAG: DUF3656 domain-containing protein [Verrucomicrobiota bacterium]|nr:DUF3656 domain-containing protein [Verrucomicrobiota bacterium]
MENASTATSRVKGPLRRPELLAPAGNWDCMRAAVQNGADAVYFGLSGFNARMRADNFNVEDLPSIMAYLHERRVHGYVTMNTLVFSAEIHEARTQIMAMVKANVDAVIVQDIGLCQLIRSVSPDFPIHASTQMTVTSSKGVAFAHALGCQRVVMARECSLKELAAIQSETQKQDDDHIAPPGLEIFVHGALCVAYSGQCLTSESLGGRSANRGECAQACRMPYELVKDGQTIDLDDQNYLLSPQDLAGLPVVPDIMRMGIHSLKIEGRLKSPAYVANVTSVYRNAIDRLMASEDAQPLTGESLYKESKYELEMAFSRGLFTGWLGGIDNQALVHARFGKKRGVFLGTILSFHREGFTLETSQPLKAGDGIVIDQGKADALEQGGRLYKVVPEKSARGTPSGAYRLALFFKHKHLDFSRIKKGDKVWKTSDPALERSWNSKKQTDTRKSRLSLCLQVSGSPHSPLEVKVTHPLEGPTFTVRSAMDLQDAVRCPLDATILRRQFGRLGNTQYQLDQLNFDVHPQTILPLSELNRMRRLFVQRLDTMARRGEKASWTLSAEAFQAPSFQFWNHRNRTRNSVQLIPLVRNMNQLDAAMRSSSSQIYCEFEDPKEYRAAVKQFHHRRKSAPSSDSTDGIWVAPPRICKPGEDWILDLILSSGADGYLIRNHDQLAFFKESNCIADYSFNVANHWTADYLLRTFPFARLTASYDLDVNQLASLCHHTPSGALEVTLHQHMPMFHMEHCVFCAFMSSGKDYRDCGRPCEKHTVALKDRVGQHHPLKADAGCRNTVFNGRAQTGAEYAQRMIQLGITHFRLEFLDESPEEVESTLRIYKELLDGERSAHSVWNKLKLINQLGVTRGTLETHSVE